MFIYNGKSLVGNKGLFIAILILLILVYFSYNKCYINNKIKNNFNNHIDTFVAPSFLPPTDVRIYISNGDIVVKFSIDNSTTNQMPKSFIIVLAQYDSNKNNTGNNTFYLSNENILNPTLAMNKSVKNTCNIVDGTPECQYVFNNIDSRDSNNNIYYYKLGISAIYKDGESPYETPYNVSSIDKMFTTITTIDNQNSVVNPQTTISANTYNNTISTADGQYELIKSQLGNYPDNLFLESQSINNNSLSDLLDKSMAQALLNVNVST
jgi:hypothetical protein